MVAAPKEKLSIRLSKARSLDEQGRLEEAGELYQGIVVDHPECGEAWFGLGVLAMRIGDLELAAIFLEQARADGLGDVAVLVNLGEVYRRLGRIDQAIDILKMACDRDKGSRDGRINLAATLAGAGRYGEALAPLQEAVFLDPKSREAWLMKGEVYKNLGQLEEAVSSFREVLLVDPQSSDARLGLAETLRLQKQFMAAIPEFEALLQVDGWHRGALTGLAAIALEQKDFAAAETFYRQALAADPEYWEALFGLGVACLRGSKYSSAEEAFRGALAIDGQRPDAWVQLGEAVFHMNRYDEAKRYYEKGLELDPNSIPCQVGIGNALLHLEQVVAAISQYRLIETSLPDEFRVHANLALAYQETGQFRLAARHGVRAVELGCHSEDVGLAQQNLAQILLRQGNLEEGWRYYEHRQSSDRGKSFSLPAWRGESLAGKRIFIWQDQGVGDVVFFATLFQEIIDEAEAVVLECDRKLLPLLRRSFPGAVVVARNLKELHPLGQNGLDCHCSGGSLPLFRRPNFASFPKPPREILRVDPLRASYWRDRLRASGDEIKVGICWRSMISKGRRDLSYSKLSEWGEIFALPGVRLVNLQYDRCESELAEAKSLFGKDVLNFQEVDMFDDLDEAAALMSQLDLVISAPTSVSMLAAAVGTPTCLATTFFDWSCLGRRRDLWFRQLLRYPRKWNQSWGEIFSVMAQDIRSRFKLD
ncbi:tetratricopeptide repeat protein [Ferribacterium limneticum]|uniref:tetratricopeptide repeat protein n=1 Tax=Ferribacterium limneticum TaxID=76259 RepID=UPI001CFA4B94|nr:tetratricopeptide repeat protein [Ferribacterium limneticum]UCV27640.1 tetratricopeptide repeat protein [Ferribacterium limneticum]UCV31557.1 tetratricopeptide repeat protein [Ferribacterium limneticum]